MSDGDKDKKRKKSIVLPEHQAYFDEQGRVAREAAAKARRAMPKMTETKAQRIAKLAAEKAKLEKELEELESGGGQGRPTAFRIQYVDRARDLCMLGLTNEEIAARFNVDITVLASWIATIPDFANAIYEGREGADAKVTSSLFKSAIGFEHPEDDIRTVSLGNNQGSEIVITPTIKRYTPNTTSIGMWLGNRQRQRWPYIQAAMGAANTIGDRSPQSIAQEIQQFVAALNSTTAAPPSPSGATNSSESMPTLSPDEE